MARVDKYDPITGGFRAHVAVDFPDADLGKLFGYGIDSGGKIVKGAGTTGVVGVWVVTSKPGRVGPNKEIAVIDCMREGCITDFCPTAGVPGTDVGVAGTAYFSDAAGVISSVAAVGSVYVGHTVEPDRLEVNVSSTLVVA